MPNFFAALDDSGDEAPAKPLLTTKESKKGTSASIAEASKPERRRRNDDRSTKGGRGDRRGYVRDGKRQYDRRSGTGRGREIKKDGDGGRNWGSDRNESREYRSNRGYGGRYERQDTNEEGYDVKENEENVNENAEEANENGGDTIKEQPNNEEEEEAEEEEDKTMTYEEYIRQKKEQSKDQSDLLVPINTPKEVENEFAGVKATVLKKEEDFTVGKSKQLRKKGTNRKESSATDKITPSFRVGDRPGYGGGGRGYDRDNRRDGGYRGRGGGRRNRGDFGGRTDRGGGRKDDSPPVDFSVTDDAFPSL